MVTIQRLAASDIALFRALNRLFGAAFEDEDQYTSKPPSDAYIAKQLAKEHVIPLVALSAGRVVGGLVAYELDKLEQERSEIYIYDLAVDQEFRRQGIATALINRLGEIAAERGAWVIYVQADYEDDPAIALYTKLGRREDVMHFDIDPVKRAT
jgi:aminoglycoside 3-N-acetyltransferase I